MNILVNDRISQSGIKILEEAGFDVNTTKVAQEQLIHFINKNNIAILLVRSATTVDKKVIDECPTLKIIGRAGVGMDNIEVEYAKQKGIKVINTPEASADSVAELVFAHLYGGVRFMHDSNRNMPLEGDSKFNSLKKAYSKGLELKGKTLGILGFGKIGQATAKIALGIGMKIQYHDHHREETTITVPFFDGQTISFVLKNKSMEDLLKTSDFLTMHVPAKKQYAIGKKEFDLMKDGVGIVNTARGGVIDEVALVDALENGKVLFAGLDVYESEPNPEIRILMHPQISLTPHIGGSTVEAQERIGIELAHLIVGMTK
ncbi:D-2-hydroxyacid dehydrogenase [Sediminicola sp. 1XM1-17]|uniref:D-2-hydroxyacid dehydrogenase n=1 Tax=Sediminicola sp. 1XM1-17 TaxID=3127702 RepID=UPI0030786C19